jgi:hypothetical protein
MSSDFANIYVLCSSLIVISKIYIIQKRLHFPYSYYGSRLVNSLCVQFYSKYTVYL